MSSKRGFVRSWAVGEFTATLTCARPQRGVTAAAVIAWSSGIPSRMTPVEVVEYRSGRDQALRELADFLGKNVCVVPM